MRQFFPCFPSFAPSAAANDCNIIETRSVTAYKDCKQRADKPNVISAISVDSCASDQFPLTRQASLSRAVAVVTVVG